MTSWFFFFRYRDKHLNDPRLILKNVYVRTKYIAYKGNSATRRVMKSQEKLFPLPSRKKTFVSRLKKNKKILINKVIYTYISKRRSKQVNTGTVCSVTGLTKLYVTCLDMSEILYYSSHY